MAKEIERTIGVTTAPTGTWVQTDRAAHEKWAKLAVKNPRAAAILHVLVAKMGRHNALVVSQQTLAKLADCSLRTIQYSLKTLKEDNWVDVRQIGQNGTVNAYIINDRVAWSGKRDGIRYSLFSSAVMLSDAEQPDCDELGAQAALMRIPELYQDEKQLPSGDGLPPPSQPSFIGLEPDLPARIVKEQ
jgi:hypothetical protein